MNRVVIIGLILILAGCPREFKAIVENTSNKDLIFIFGNSENNEVVIRAESIKELYVSPGCNLVKVEGKIKSINFSKIPNDTWVSGFRGKVIEFNIVFNGENFNLKSKSGDLYKLTTGDVCENA